MLDHNEDRRNEAAEAQGRETQTCLVDESRQMGQWLFRDDDIGQ